MPPTRLPKARSRSSGPAVVHAASEPIQAAEEAFSQGDFLRARTLLQGVLRGEAQLPAPLQTRLAARLAALGFDPFAIQVGLATLVLYGVAWAWALQQR